MMMTTMMMMALMKTTKECCLYKTSRKLLSSLLHRLGKPSSSSSVSSSRSSRSGHSKAAMSHGTTTCGGYDREGQWDHSYAPLVVMEELKLEDPRKAPQGYVPVLLMGQFSDDEDDDGGVHRSCIGHDDDDDDDDAYNTNSEGSHGNYGGDGDSDGDGDDNALHFYHDGSIQLVFIHASMLGHPVFADLLQHSALVFGYSGYHGPLRLPCRYHHLRNRLLQNHLFQNHLLLTSPQPLLHPTKLSPPSRIHG